MSIYGHLCPKFMEDVDLTVEDLDIRAALHCGLLYKKIDPSLKGEETEHIKDMLKKYEEYLKKYNPVDNPEYFY
jgi:hypothetical protein